MHCHLWTLHWHRSLSLSIDPHLVVVLHAAVVAAVIVIVVPAAAMAVAAEEVDSVDYSVAAAVAVADVDTEVVAHFEESQKLYLLGPSC